MLVVTANWGISDGTLAAAANPRRIARAWLRSVRSTTLRAGFGRDGSYRPPVRLDIVLAGDTLDSLVSAAWRGHERPWHAGNRAADLRRGVLVRCARRASPLFAGLAALVRRGLQVPAPDHRGRPSTSGTMRIPVRVSLLSGDRDRHIDDLAAEFAARGAAVASAWSDGAVLVRHGHEFDPLCHVEEAITESRPPTLGESVAVDLVGRFAAGLNAASTPMRAVAPLVESLAAAGPLDVPAIIATWLAANGPDVEHDCLLRRGVVTTWRRAIDEWAREARLAPPECGVAANPVDDLAAWFATERPEAPPAVITDFFHRSTPLTIASGDRCETVILGHRAMSADSGAVICLGRPPVRPWCSTAVVRADSGMDVACVAASPATTTPMTITVSRCAGHAVGRRIAGVDFSIDDHRPRDAVIVEAA